MPRVLFGLFTPDFGVIFDFEQGPWSNLKHLLNVFHLFGGGGIGKGVERVDMATEREEWT